MMRGFGRVCIEITSSNMGATLQTIVSNGIILKRITYVDDLRVRAVVMAYETLEILYKNYDCHIVTNGITRIQKGRMHRSELKPFIKELFISEEMGVSKPDVRYFDLVKEKLNPDPDDLLIVIGDSLSSDMKGAVDSGLKAIWYNPNHLPAPSFLLDGIVDDLRKLPSIIQQL